MKQRVVNEATLVSVFLSIIQQIESSLPELLVPRKTCTALALGYEMNQPSQNQIALFTMISCIEDELGTPNERDKANQIFKCLIERTEQDRRRLLVSSVDEKASALRMRVLRLIPPQRTLRAEVEGGSVVVTLVDNKSDPSRVFVANLPLSHNCFVSLEAGVLVDGDFFSFTLNRFLGFLPIMIPGRGEVDWDELILRIVKVSEAFLSVGPMTKGTLAIS